MKFYFSLLLTMLMLSCGVKKTENSNDTAMTQNQIKNEKLKNHIFLKNMESDPYFPNHLVDKGKAILIELCLEIERDIPKTLKELYKLTQEATNRFNDLESEFDNSGSEIETVAREAIAVDFEFIAKAYDFDADLEELIATRNW